MATFTLFDEFIFGIGRATNGIGLDTDTFKAYLSNTAPDVAEDLVKADLAEISAGNGYSSGGSTMSISFAESGSATGVWIWTGGDVSFTASGGNIATHRYLVVYSDTSSGDQLVGYVDRGSTDVIVDGNTRTWDVSSSGHFQVTTTP